MYVTQDEFGIFWDPNDYARAMDGHALQVFREDIADIIQQDITPVILRSLVPLRPEPHSEPGGGPVPLYQTKV